MRSDDRYIGDFDHIIECIIRHMGNIHHDTGLVHFFDHLNAIFT